MTLTRRATILGALANPAILRHARADTIVRMGTLKLIHSITPYFYQQFAPADTTIQIIPFESPTDGKDALVSGTVDFGTFGIAAAILGASAHQPVVVIGSACNKGMAIVAGKSSGIDKLTDLKGKRVAIQPGSTQEVFMGERLRMEGMSMKDITPVRVSFSEMNAALARGDVDAYVGAEPGPGLSLSSGVGKIVEYPYSTPMGSLNMILATNRNTVDHKPELARLMVELQRKASTYAMADRAAMVPAGSLISRCRRLRRLRRGAAGPERGAGSAHEPKPKSRRDQFPHVPSPIDMLDPSCRRRLPDLDGFHVAIRACCWSQAAVPATPRRKWLRSIRHARAEPGTRGRTRPG